jgi:hypothetical protein
LWALALWAAASGADAATFTFINMDGVGEGLNDPTVVTPVGGNNATTLGQARLNVLQEAGRVWGLQLTSSVNIVVEAKFDPLTCSATMGTLGQAGALYVFSDFPNAPLPNVFYPAALADALAGQDINSRHDIGATFNSNVGMSTCLGGASFYLGFDHSPVGNSIDLLNVVLHEYGHGLGFESAVIQDGTSQFTTSGNLAGFDQFLYSEALAKFFPAMTAAERATAITSNGSLVWNGSATNSQVGLLTAGQSTGGHFKMYAPATYSDGSSTSHWDTSSQWRVGVNLRSLLMEPFITANPNGLTDVTGCVLRDIGWQGTRCPDALNTNTPPLAQAQSVSATEDTPVQITLRATDTDTPGALTYSIVSQPTRGTLTAPASLSSANGVIYTYTPNANLNGTDSFTFQASDGTNLSNTATVTVNVAAVNDPPVANAQTLNATAGTALVITLTGSDVENSSLTYSFTPPANGTLTGTAPNLTYTANSSFSGIDTFSFHVNDGSLDSASATITINVAARAASGGGGGGSLGEWSLALLLLQCLLRFGVPMRCAARRGAPSWGKGAGSERSL